MQPASSDATQRTLFLWEKVEMVYTCIGIEPMNLCTLGKHSAIKLYFQGMDIFLILFTTYCSCFTVELIPNIFQCSKLFLDWAIDRFTIEKDETVACGVGLNWFCKNQSLMGERDSVYLVMQV